MGFLSETKAPRLPLNPYTATAGPEMDSLIHLGLMNQAGDSGQCPAYSTDENLAQRVLAKLRTGKLSVIVGRTTLQDQTWFARYERNAMDGTEVFADTFALAVCRLALLHLHENGSGR